MSCKLDYIYNNVQDTELADKLNDLAIGKWQEIESSGLFTLKNNSYYFNKVGTKKREKQDEFIKNINGSNIVTEKDNKVSVDVSSMFPKQDTLPISNENNQTLTEEQNKNISDLKSIAPEYSKFSNEDIQYAIEQLIPDSKVRLYRIENKNIPYDNSREGIVSKKEIIGGFFTNSLDTVSNYIRKNQSQEGIKLIYVDINLKDLDKYHVSNNEFAKTMDVENDNWVIPATEKRNEVDLSSLSKVTGNIFTLKTAKEALKTTIDNLKDKKTILNSPETISKITDIINERNNVESIIGLSQISKAEQIAEDVLDKLSTKFNIPWKWTETGTNKGYIKDGVIYINKNSFTEDTLFHEFAHPFIEYLSQENPTVYKLLLANANKVINSNTGKRVIDEVKKKYKDYSGDQLDKEIITEALGLAAIDKLEEPNRSSFLTMVDKFLEIIGKVFGVDISLNTPYKDLAQVLHNDTKIDLSSYMKGDYFQRDNSLTQDDIADRFKQWSTQFVLEPIKHIYTNIATKEVVDSVHKLVVDPIYDKNKKYKKEFTEAQQNNNAISASFGTGIHDVIQYTIDSLLNDDHTLNIALLDSMTIEELVLELKSFQIEKFSRDHEITKEDGSKYITTVSSVISDKVLLQSMTFIKDLLNYNKELHGEDAKYYTEQKVFSSDFEIKGVKTNILGTADLIIVEGPSKEDGAYYINDWKTTATEYNGQFSKVQKDSLDAMKKLAFKEQQIAYGKIIGGNFKGAIAYPIGANLGYNFHSKSTTLPSELQYPNVDPLKADPNNRVLFPVVINGEEIVEKSIEELIIKLRYLQTEIVSGNLDIKEDETPYERNQRGKSLERIIEDLETRKSIDSLVNEISQFLIESNDTLSTMQLEDVEKTQDLIEVYINVGDYLDSIPNLNEIDLGKGLALQKKVNTFSNLLNKKREELLLGIAKDVDVKGLLNAETSYNLLSGLFKPSSNITNVKTINLFSKLKRAALNVRDMLVKKELTSLTTLTKGLKDYGSKNGLSISKVYHKFLKKDKDGKVKPQLIDRYSAELYVNLAKVLESKDLVELGKYIDISEYNKNYAKAIERVKNRWDEILETQEFSQEDKDAYRAKESLTVTDEDLIDMMKSELKYRKVNDYEINHRLISEGKLNTNAIKNLFSVYKQEGKPTKAYIKDHQLLALKESVLKNAETLEFKEIQNNPELKAFYDFMIKQNQLALDLKNIKYKELYTFVPKMLTTYLEKVERGDSDMFSAKIILENLSTEQVNEDYITNRKFNPIKNTYEKKVLQRYKNDYTKKTELPDGTILNDYSNYSLDLGSLYALYSVSLHDYKAKVEVGPIADAILNLEKTKKNIITNRWGQVDMSTGAKREENLKENVKLLETIIDREIYGITHKSTVDRTISVPTIIKNEKGFPTFKWKKVSATKSMLGLIAFNSHTNLGLNFLASAATYFGGTVNSIFEANRGNNYTKKDYIESSKAVASIFSKNLMSDKDLTLIGLIDPMMENENLHRSVKLSSTKLRKIFNTEFLYEMMRRADRSVQYTLALAISKNFIIVNDKLYNVNDYAQSNYNINGKSYNDLVKEGTDLPAINQARKEIAKQVIELKKQSVYALSKMEGDNLNTPLTDELVGQLRDVIRSQSAKVIGNMSNDDKINAKNTVLGTALMQYRNWMPSLIEQRFGGAEMDNFGNLSWGKSRTFIDAVRSDFFSMLKSTYSDINEVSLGKITKKYEELLNDHISKGGDKEAFVSLAKFTEYYLSNVKSQLKEIVMMASFLMLMYAFSSLIGWDPDDPDKSGSQKFAYKMYGKLSQELNFFYSPTGLGGVLNKPLPVLSTLENIEKLFVHTAQEGYYRGKGAIGMDAKEDIKRITPSKELFKLPVLKEVTGWLATFDNDFRKEYNIKIQY